MRTAIVRDVARLRSLHSEDAHMHTMSTPQAQQSAIDVQFRVLFLHALNHARLRFARGWQAGDGFLSAAGVQKVERVRIRD
jgi:hypothetical protein